MHIDTRIREYRAPSYLNDIVIRVTVINTYRHIEECYTYKDDNIQSLKILAVYHEQELRKC